MSNFRVYISFSGEYPSPPVRDGDNVPVMQSGTFTLINTYDNNLTLSRQIEKRLPSKSPRWFLNGSILLQGDYYDAIVTAIGNNFNYLIIKIDVLIGVTWTEKWRGTVNIRNTNDINTKTITLSVFETIDEYTDLINTLKNTWNVKNDSLADPAIIERAVGTALIYGLEEIHEMLTINDEGQFSPLYWTYLEYNEVFGQNDTGTESQLLQIGELTKNIDNAETAKGFDLSISVILNLFEDLYGIWFKLEEYEYLGSKYYRINLYKIKDFYDVPIVVDFIDESRDFLKVEYLDKNLVRFERYKLSEKNISSDNISRDFKYDINNELETIVNYEKYFTDLERIFDGDKDELNDTDLIICITNYKISNQYWIEKGVGIYDTSGDLVNYRSTQAVRMDVSLLNWRQLDYASFNGSIQAVNPDVPRFLEVQQRFPILRSTFFGAESIFYLEYETDVGLMRLAELHYHLMSNKTEMILTK